MRVNKIPASCANSNCSFTFPKEMAAVVSSISPSYGGQNNNAVTIVGLGFTNDSSMVTVTIGNKPCVVESVQDTEIVCVPSPNKAGTYNVRVHIEGTGYAVPDNTSNPVTFQYNIEVHDIEPNIGSVGGGEEIVISGAGFPEVLYKESVFYVLVDDCPCRVNSVNLTQIVCQPQGHAPNVVNITIWVDETDFLIEEAYEYSFNVTALISSVTPSTGPTYGGTEIIITGKNFGASNDVLFVMIGDSECEVVNHNDTSITCITSSNPPGSYDIIMHSSSFGIALRSDIESNTEILDYLCVDRDNMTHNTSVLLYQYLYELTVTSFSPCSGSVLGGTFITILGTGFGMVTDNVSVVDQNGAECRVESVNNEEIQCVTASPMKIHFIDNSGEHESEL